MASPEPRVPSDYTSILARVSAWPFETRVALMQEVLKTLVRKDEAMRPRGRTLDHAEGLLSGPWLTPTDEDVARLIEESRREKYG